LRPDARYVWVGDGPARAALAARNPDFIFTGVQRGAGLARHYASADLFVFPSLTETFGNVTLEALASGVATVAFDYGAAREYLNESCGRLVPFGDEDAFVDAVCEMVGDRRAPSCARTAARAAVAELDPNAVIANFVQRLAALGSTQPTQPELAQRDAATAVPSSTTVDHADSPFARGAP
jgi:glycosyltransferase involved in cell wall biosynthesis